MTGERVGNREPHHVQPEGSVRRLSAVVRDDAHRALSVEVRLATPQPSANPAPTSQKERFQKGETRSIDEYAVENLRDDVDARLVVVPHVVLAGRWVRRAVAVGVLFRPAEVALPNQWQPQTASAFIAKYNVLHTKAKQIVRSASA